VITGVVFLHVVALHITGSNNPLGIDVKSESDTLPFHPYYTAKDSVGMAFYFLIFAVLVFYAPNFFGEPDNYIVANPLQTPNAIVPEWYFLPFYAILRSVPNKLAGVLAMFGSIMVWFVLPWLDTSPVRSARFRPMYRISLITTVVSFFVLMWCGSQHPQGLVVIIGRVATAWYFLHFLVLVPAFGFIETPLPLPESISKPVLPRNSPPGGGGPLPSGAAAKPMEKQ
jgi:ubiquinol-cytochrome c reductase cytochrome b/c1 subunit